MHAITYTGFTALKLCGIETPHCPRLRDTEFHVLYTARQQRPRRLNTRYLKLPDAFRNCSVIIFRHGETTVRCTHPLVTWAMLATFLTQTETIALLDAILRAGSRSAFPNGIPLTMGNVSAFLDNAGDFPALKRCRAAVPFIGVVTDSIMECRTLLALLRYGLPYPSVHLRVYIASLDLTVPVDMAYGNGKVIVEYDGDAHRQDQRQYRWDERKRQALRAQGCTVIVAFADDVTTASGRWALADRVADALGVTLDGWPQTPYRVLIDDDRRAEDRDRKRRERRKARAEGLA
ncbi:hypothetical protein DSM100685_1077 [Bifidobacterium avesanii]|nr:hypothetical protein DSM100685_1077 [Bifidobacterium avesanii]